MSAAPSLPGGRTAADGQTETQADATFDDTRNGLAMFVIFSSAVLIATGGVALVALVGTWWMLGVAFAIHVLMTAAVVATIAFVMDGGSRGKRATAL